MLSRTYQRPLLWAGLLTMALGACHPDKEKDPAPTTPVAAFAFSGGTCQTTCPVTFENKSQNATKYTWDFGDSTTGTQADAQFTHAYAHAGAYQVKLTAEGPGGANTTTQQVNVGTGCAMQVVQVTSNISTATAWDACHVYVVSGEIWVSGALTVQPGTVVKFKPSGGLQLQPGGSLNAVGTAAQPVVFTSFKDDAHGGDTNADGTASTPARKDWHHLNLSGGSSGARLEYCQFLYGGGDTGSANYTLGLDGAAATVRGCTFAHNAGGATSKVGALAAGDALVGTVIENNTFFDNELPLRITNLFSLDDSNTFQNPQNANQKNDYQGIWVEETPGKSAALTWAETELPYVLETTGWDARLTLGPGVILKQLPDAQMHFGNGGELLARGTSAQPIVFTSYKDDAHGGDTNHDGSATAPAKQDWTAVLLDGITGSALDHCQFYYGGRGGTVLDLSFSAASITNGTFAHNGEDVSVLAAAALDASYAQQGTVLQGNVFYDNVRPLSITSSFDLDDSNTFHNPASPGEKNQYQAIITYWNSNVSKPGVSWGETEVAYANTHDIDLTANHTLQFGNNVTVKLLSDVEITCRTGAGQLLNANGAGVTFTSYKDDSRGGDSNGNGAANGPSRGDWEGIYLDQVPGGGWQQWGNMHYAAH